MANTPLRLFTDETSVVIDSPLLDIEVSNDNIFNRYTNGIIVEGDIYTPADLLEVQKNVKTLYPIQQNESSASTKQFNIASLTAINKNKYEIDNFTPVSLKRKNTNESEQEKKRRENERQEQQKNNYMLFKRIDHSIFNTKGHEEFSQEKVDEVNSNIKTTDAVDVSLPFVLHATYLIRNGLAEYTNIGVESMSVDEKNNIINMAEFFINLYKTKIEAILRTLDEPTISKMFCDNYNDLIKLKDLVTSSRESGEPLTGLSTVIFGGREYTLANYADELKSRSQE